MPVFAVVARRTALHRDTLVLLAVAAASSWLVTSRTGEALGAGSPFLRDVRHGALLLVGVLGLSLAEPLHVGPEARGGLLLLRHGRGGGFALVSRWVGLVLGVLPAVLVSALAARGLPGRPLDLLRELAVVGAGGLLLGSYLARPRLVAALWCLVVAGHLRAWILDSAPGALVGWVLPDLAGQGGAAWVHSGLWCAAALILADRRLGQVASRPGPG